MKKLLALLAAGSLVGMFGLADVALADHHEDKEKPAEQASEKAKEAVDKEMPAEANEMAAEKSGKDQEDGGDDGDGTA